jgi:hypothetical protein
MMCVTSVNVTNQVHQHQFFFASQIATVKQLIVASFLMTFNIFRLHFHLATSELTSHWDQIAQSLKLKTSCSDWLSTWSTINQLRLAGITHMVTIVASPYWAFGSPIEANGTLDEFFKFLHSGHLGTSFDKVLLNIWIKLHWRGVAAWTLSLSEPNSNAANHGAELLKKLRTCRQSLGIILAKITQPHNQRPTDLKSLICNHKFK